MVLAFEVVSKFLSFFAGTAQGFVCVVGDAYNESMGLPDIKNFF